MHFSFGPLNQFNIFVNKNVRFAAGIALLLPYCSTVNVVEYVPTQRSVQRCHYYAPNANPLCTYGVWHPLAAEKIISYAMNTASDRTVFYDGYISIPGYSKVMC